MARVPFAFDASSARARLEQLWTADRPALATLSVRSAFDLYLQSVDWEPGSEVLLTAVTVPHMAELIEAHGFVPVGVQLPLSTMWPTVDELETLRTPRTRAVLVAHLFGARGDLSGIARWCRVHDLTLVEDAAQRWQGREFCGDPEADLSFFSFGTIKTATSLGGAIVTGRDSGLVDTMRDLQDRYDVQPRRQYLAKLLKGLLFWLLSNPILFGIFFRVVDLTFGLGSTDRILRNASRSFPAETFPQALRYQPSTPLLATMYAVERRYDATRVTARANAGEYLRKLLEDARANLVHLGGQSPRHSHWLFPVAVDNPKRLVDAARDAGFDVTDGASTLVAVPMRHANGARNELERAMAHVVYLPVYPEMSQRDIERLADAVTSAA
jgi:dTDP-4-amino-4,6-dideoxygalactose transaminase